VPDVSMLPQCRLQPLGWSGSTGSDAGDEAADALGKVLRAAVFTSSDGTTFVAAILGLYAGTRISFTDR
jgi:hypothetical protein